MITHKFEHPLNEKTRIYLRVESLLRQLHLSSTFSDAQQYQLVLSFNLRFDRNL